MTSSLNHLSNCFEINMIVSFKLLSVVIGRINRSPSFNFLVMISRMNITSKGIRVAEDELVWH